MILGSHIVHSLIRERVPRDAILVVGGVPFTDPEWNITIQDRGGSGTTRVIGTAVPRFITYQTSVAVRDRNRDSQHMNEWARFVTGIIQEILLKQRGVPFVENIEEYINITAGQNPISVSATYGPVWASQTQGPIWKRYSPKFVGLETTFAVKFDPTRIRPKVVEITNNSNIDISGSETSHNLVSSVIPPSGYPGRTWVGGEVTFGTPQPITIGPDEAFPTGAAQGPLPGGESALRWRNTNVATDRAPGGRWELFDVTQTNLVPIDNGGQVLTRFDTAEITPNGLELKFNRRFSTEFEHTGAFYLQQAGRPVTPERFVFRLSSASPPEDRGGEYVYTFPFEYQVGGQEIWNWGFGLTTEFLGVATETTPPNSPQFSVVWQSTWEDGTEIVRDTFIIPREESTGYYDNNLRRLQLPATLSQRPAGGTITQTLSITDQTPGFNRLQAYRTSLEFSGKIIYGEHEVSGDIPESSQRQAFHSGFDEGFE